MVSNSALQGVPLLIVANKQDLEVVTLDDEFFILYLPC